MTDKALTAPPRNGVRRYNPVYVDASFTPTGAMTYTVNEAGIALVEQMSAGGHALETIAKALGISNTTFGEIRKRQPEVQDAVRTGEAVLRDELVSELLKQARKGNTTAAIFLAKARTHMRDVGPTDPNAQGAGPQVAIQINAPLTDEQFEAIMQNAMTPRPLGHDGGGNAD